MKTLPGKVAPVTARSTPDPTRDAVIAERQAVIAAAARAYVTELHAWNEHITALRRSPAATRYTTDRRRRLHAAQRRLVDAVTKT